MPRNRALSSGQSQAMPPRAGTGGRAANRKGTRQSEATHGGRAASRCQAGEPAAAGFRDVDHRRLRRIDGRWIGLLRTRCATRGPGGPAFFGRTGIIPCMCLIYCMPMIYSSKRAARPRACILLLKFCLSGFRASVLTYSSPDHKFTARPRLRLHACIPNGGPPGFGFMGR